MGGGNLKCYAGHLKAYVERLKTAFEKKGIWWEFQTFWSRKCDVELAWPPTSPWQLWMATKTFPLCRGGAYSFPWGGGSTLCAPKAHPGAKGSCTCQRHTKLEVSGGMHVPPETFEILGMFSCILQNFWGDLDGLFQCHFWHSTCFW